MRDKVLVVVDMQNDFTTGVLGNEACVAVIDKVKEELKKDYTTALFTRDTHNEDYLETEEGKNIPIPHCIKDTDGWYIVQSLIDTANDNNNIKTLKIFNKPTYGSVDLGTYLQKIYGEGNQLDITFVGVCTGICVINNVAITKAFCPNAKVHVVADACACVTPESHNTALETMKTFKVDVIE